MKKRLLTVIISALIISTSMLAGCGCSNNTATADEVTTTVSETHEVSDTSSTAATETTLSKEEQAIIDAGLKVDDKGNITDKNGKKVEVNEKGKIEVKTEDGKTVTVSVSEVSTANENNSKINTSTSSKSSTTGSSSSKSSATGSTSSKSSSSSKTSSSSSKSSSTSSKTSSSSSSSKTSSSSSSSGSSSSKQESSKAETHTHTWVNITEQIKVIDQEAYSYEEDVYETKRRPICNDCGADMGDWSDSDIDMHIYNHIISGGKGSYSVKSVKVKTGTKTVNVPEQSHYENQTIGRKCSSCGKTEYY